MKNILRSKYFIMLIASVIVITAVLAFGALKITGKFDTATDISEFAEADVREVVPAGKYKNIYIVNGEKGIFLGKSIKENSWCVLYDGKKAEDLKFNGYFDKMNPEAALLTSNEGAVVLFTDKENADYELKKYKYADIDSEGKYVLYLNEEPGENSYIVEDSNGKTVYKLSEKKTDRYDSLRFSGKEDCLIKVVDERDILFNMKTGEEIYKAPEDAAIKGYIAGYLVVSMNEKKSVNSVQYRFLDENLKPVDIVADADNYYANEEVAAYEGGASHNYFIGKGAVLGEEKYGFDPYLSADDSIAFRTEDKYTYLTIENGKYKVVAESEYLSRRDFDDGFAPAIKGDEYYFEDNMYIDKDENKWGIIDKNMKPVTAFKFNGVSRTENGYAVVGIERKQAVIDLKGVK